MVLIATRIGWVVICHYQLETMLGLEMLTWSEGAYERLLWALI